MPRLILIAALAVVLVAALAACGGSSGGSATETAAPTPTATATAGAAAIWQNECAGCHSPDPAGVGVADAAQVRRVIEHGAEGMPSFAGKLSRPDIRAVSEYVAKASN